MSAWLVIRWCITIPLGFIWVFCAAGHICSMIGVAKRGDSMSVIPFIGGVSGAFAVLVCPLVGWYWFWLPPLVDFGGFWILTSMLHRRTIKLQDAPKYDETGDA